MKHSLMLFEPLLHGGNGYLDEILECGGLLAIVLLIYFVNALRKPNDESERTSDETDASENERHER